MGNDDFWESLIHGHTNTSVKSAVDQHLSGKAFGGDFESVRNLTDRQRDANALGLPVPAGSRVAFIGSLGAVLSDEDPPARGAQGEVVTVRSATHGDLTAYDGKVFVKWDDGKFRPIYATYLRLVGAPKTKRAFKVRTGDPTDPLGGLSRKVNRIRVASLGDLTSFLKVADGTLVHKSTKDLWAFSKDADGGLVVERLFDDTGEPLKG